MPTALRERPKPFLLPEFCKGCGRCIDACAKDCITTGREIDPRTGLVPVTLNLEACNGCGLCLDACPEPYGLRPQPEGDFELQDPEKLFGTRAAPPRPATIPPRAVPLPPVAPLVLKGNYAAAIGALVAGCRHVFGYPITPSTEGAELMAKLLPKLDGVFLQAVSEVATVNMMYGCGGAGLPCMTFTSSPGFSLMLEGISYMIGAEVPGVFVNVMRGGPGLGNIAPEQADVKLACRGLGHGNTHAIVLAPSTPQEMLDLTRLAFELSFRYRNPVVIVADGYLGQMTGKVVLPRHDDAARPSGLGGLRRRCPPRQPHQLDLPRREGPREPQRAPEREVPAHGSRAALRRCSPARTRRRSSSRSARRREWPRARSRRCAARACASASSGRSRCGRSRSPR